MYEICHNSIAFYGHSIHQLLSGAELPVILEFFTGVVNTTSTPVGWDGEQVAIKWWAKIMSTLKTAKWHFHWCHFHLHISHKAAKSIAKLVIHLCGELQPAICLSRGDGVIYKPPKHLWTTDKPQQKQPGQCTAPIPA